MVVEFSACRVEPASWWWPAGPAALERWDGGGLPARHNHIDVRFKKCRNREMGIQFDGICFSFDGFTWVCGGIDDFVGVVLGWPNAEIHVTFAPSVSLLPNITTSMHVLKKKKKKICDH